MSKRPVVLVVMDGIGINASEFGNAVKKAYKPTLDELWENYPHTEIKAHGLAVGLPSDGDMGNSEVGHNALGCGQIYSQGAKLVNEILIQKKFLKQKHGHSLLKTVKMGKCTLLDCCLMEMYTLTSIT